MLHLGMHVLEGLQYSLSKLKEAVFSSGQSEEKHVLRGFREAGECLLLTVVSLEPSVSVKVCF